MQGIPGESATADDDAPAISLSTADQGLFRRAAGAIQRVDGRNRHLPQAPPEALARLQQLERTLRNRHHDAERHPEAFASARAVNIAADHALFDADVSHPLRDEGTVFLRAGCRAGCG